MRALKDAAVSIYKPNGKIKVKSVIEELKSAAECGTNACCGLYGTKPDFKKTK